MRKIFVCCAFVLSFFPLNAQTVDTVTYVQDLTRKERAVLEDSVRLFVLQSGRKYADFLSGIEALKSAGILPDGEYSADEPLRRGTLALMTARYLNLDDSVWYALFGAERYAYAACVSDGIMRGGQSPSEQVSGPELVEVLGTISSRTEDGDGK